MAPPGNGDRAIGDDDAKLLRAAHSTYMRQLDAAGLPFDADELDEDDAEQDPGAPRHDGHRLPATELPPERS